MRWYSDEDMKPILIAITGEPCSGKTTLMRAILTASCEFQGGNTCIYNSVPIVYTTEGRMGVVGLYNDETALGVDDQDVYLPDLGKEHDFLEKFAGYVIFMEGVRLLDHKFLKWAREMTELRIIELTSSVATIRSRMNTRGGAGKVTPGEWGQKYIGQFRGKYPIQAMENNLNTQIDAVAGAVLKIARGIQMENVA